MKLKPLKKPSFSEQILEVANRFPNGFTIEDIQHTKKQERSVRRAFQALVDSGKLNHDAYLESYSLPKNSETVRVTAPWRDDQESLGWNDESKTNLIDDLHSRLDTMEEKYQDALAVVRYLENKLITAIQYANKQDDDDLRQ